MRAVWPGEAVWRLMGASTSYIVEAISGLAEA